MDLFSVKFKKKNTFAKYLNNIIITLSKFVYKAIIHDKKRLYELIDDK